MPDRPERDRSDYFTWKSGDLVPADAPAPPPEERPLPLDKMPPEVSEEAEALLKPEEGEEKDGESQ